MQLLKAKVRLTLRMTNLRPLIRPRRKKKIRRRSTKRDKKDKMVAPP